MVIYLEKMLGLLTFFEIIYDDKSLVLKAKPAYSYKYDSLKKRKNGMIMITSNTLILFGFNIIHLYGTS